jgi:hypothetical protein
LTTENNLRTAADHKVITHAPVLAATSKPPGSSGVSHTRNTAKFDHDHRADKQGPTAYLMAKDMMAISTRSEVLAPHPHALTDPILPNRYYVFRPILYCFSQAQGAKAAGRYCSLLIAEGRASS